MLDELKRTWSLGSPRGDFPDSLARRLTDARDTLNAHTDRMHRPHPVAGLTPYQVIGQLARLHQDGRRPSALRLEAPETWSADALTLRHEAIHELARRVEDIGRPDEHPWRGIGLTMVIPTSVARLIARIREVADYLGQWRGGQAALAAILETALPGRLAEPGLVQLGRRVASAPEIDGTALGARIWDADRARVIALLQACRDYQDAKASLEGQITPGAWDADIATILAQLSWLPHAFGEEAFIRVQALHRMLPRLFAGAQELQSDLGIAGGEQTLASVTRLVTTGERVAVAPHASPEAFAATVWDHGVEQAGDLADAVSVLEVARQAIGSRVTEAAWATDVADARQALATHTGLMKRLNADWRRAGAVARSVFKNPDAPFADLLADLDTLMKAQAALKMVREGDTFGRAAFGTDWRGERSASAPLLALVAWMRTLRGLGAEPRLIAGRVPNRSAIGDTATMVRQLLDDAKPLLAGLWADLGPAAGAAFGQAPSAERADLSLAIMRVAAMADADAACRAVLDGHPDLPERLSRLRRIVSCQASAQAVADGLDDGLAAFGSAWRGTGSDWAGLGRAADWIDANGDVRHLAARIPDRTSLGPMADAMEAGCASILAGIDELLSALATDSGRIFGFSSVADTPVVAIEDRLALWTANAELLSKWVAYRDRADRAATLGVGDLANRLHDGRIFYRCREH